MTDDRIIEAVGRENLRGFPVATCPTCGSDDPAYLPPAGNDPDIRVACLDPFHDEGTGCYLPAEGYGHADARAWRCACGDGMPDEALAYIERLESGIREWERVAQERRRVLRLIHKAVRDPSLPAISMCVAIGILVKSWAEKEADRD